MTLSMKVSVVAGGAGFIGTNLLPSLLQEGREVVVVDNMSRGSADFAGNLPGIDHSRLHVFACDCNDAARLDEVFAFAAGRGELDEVWHLAANSDIPAGVQDATVDLKDTFMTTFHLLQGMKKWKVGALHFASSSAIYGDLGDTVLHEAIGPLLPISNYGAMKLASEAQASAAAESYLSRVNIFRFPNVVGVPATHGVIMDFVNKLINSPERLQVLGDGTQQKSYLHVSDLVTAMMQVRDRASSHKVEVVNIGPTDDGVTVRYIAEQVVARVRPDAATIFGEGNKGWVGDVPKFTYSTAKIQAYGWRPALGSAQAIQRAVDEIAKQLGQ